MFSVFTRGYPIPFGGEEESKDIPLLSSVDVGFDQKTPESSRPFPQVISLYIFPEFRIPIVQFSFWIFDDISLYILSTSRDACRDHNV